MSLIKSSSREAIEKNIRTEIAAGKPREQAVAIALNVARHLRSGGGVEPTQAQKSAGNYKKAHVVVHGLGISIENPRGTVRRGVDKKTNRRWSVRMPDHYGYIKRTEGADGDHVDCTVGPDPHSDTVFVIDQQDAETKKFDEHKCMIGYASENEALRAYKKSFSDGRGRERIKHVRRMSVAEFKRWLIEGDTTQEIRKFASGGAVPDFAWIGSGNPDEEPVVDKPETIVPRPEPLFTGETPSNYETLEGGNLPSHAERELVDETKGGQKPQQEKHTADAAAGMSTLERVSRRLVGTMPGEERTQLWPERLVRSGTTLAGDVFTGKLAVAPPGLRREDITDIPGEAQPNDELLERAQDIAGLILAETSVRVPPRKVTHTSGVKREIPRDTVEPVKETVPKNEIPRDTVEPVKETVPKNEMTLRTGAGDEGVGPVHLGRMESRPVEIEAGRVEWKTADGLTHRTDGPAIEMADGAKEWWQNGKYHRTDGPAIEWADGAKEWWQNGKYHRTDGPAIEMADGAKEWYQNGEYHRTDGPAIERADGAKEWYQNGKYHRTDGPAIEWADGAKEWWQNGKYHRTDGPAIERADGAKEWYQNGKYHRTDGPAIERADGAKEWYQNGKYHRTDGPAIERADGTKVWYQDGEYHRTDGPAIEMADGTKEWYQNGKLHRTNGPAIERADGTKMWYQNGGRHRTDGPAVERADGTKEWWISGERQEPPQPQAPGFYSAVERAVEHIPQGKMTGQQWLGTLRNKPGVKPEEMDWIGLTEFLESRRSEPTTQQQVKEFIAENKVDLREVLKQSSETKFERWSQGGGENYRELLLTLPKSKDKFTKSHWEESNVLVHTRVDDKMVRQAATPELIAERSKQQKEIAAKKSLNIEEIQSDWHQKGRDTGYKERGVPDAPFKKTWPELVLKRLLTEAAEKGYERMSWTTGKTQNNRYNLTKHVDRIDLFQRTDGLYGLNVRDKHGRNVISRQLNDPPNELPELIGRELTEKLVSQPFDTGGVRSLSGLDLDIGGSGMTGFYDQMIPKMIEKIGKQWGLKAQRGEIATGVEVHYVDIPKKMREDIMSGGQPLFARGGPVSAPDDEKRRAADGSVQRTVDWAKELTRTPGKTGSLVSTVGGRTDHLPLEVPGGAYVLPADFVSAVGQGNTLSGLKVLEQMFKITKGKSLPRAPKTAKFAAGGAVPIMAAGGEFVVPPEAVIELGDGDLDRGHDVLDAWVLKMRKNHINTLKNLPGPEQS